MSLPVGFDVVGATREDFVGSVPRHGTVPAEGSFQSAAAPLGDPDRVRRLGPGFAPAVAGTAVLSARRCEPTEHCELIWTDTLTEEPPRTIPVPAGRAVTSRLVLDDSGRYAAFQLARPDPDPRYDPGHPGGPSDLAVLDLGTGRLSVVPGVELAPKASAGLALSRDGRWLLIGLNEGRRARLLVWRPGMGRPMLSPVADASSAGGVETRGLEPLTPALQRRCSAS